MQDSSFMEDNFEIAHSKLSTERRRQLSRRFPGWYRADVKETNDPLRMHRVRVKVPELHNENLGPEELPWAVPAPGLGGQGAGSWTSPMIDDEVFVAFEKEHPYSIIYTAAADATRRKFYAQQSIYGRTPLPVDEKGEIADPPDDFLEDYLPKDERPMSNGVRDRYGSFFIMNSTGFFPVEHAATPAAVGTDGVAQSDFNASEQAPEVNNPDTKYMAGVTKYGHMFALSDVGYNWKEEFDGDFDADEEFETERSKLLTKILNEDEPTATDQRRIELKTRYGHKLEMRDVGWNRTREGEYVGERKDIGIGGKDQRWVKLRSKGGMIFQMIDVGSDAEEDEFIKRLTLDETGDKVDEESSFGEDGRQMRLVTRYGFKLALDDRCSDPIDAEGKETPRGNGVLIKGRRDGKGFGIEFNEKDERNNILLYTPKSKAFEMNDRHDYIMLCTDMSGDISEPWVKLSDNEFALTQTMSHDPERDTFHLKMDKENGYTRLKTPLFQGIEMRDKDQVWTEMRDADDRGIFLSQDRNLGAWRSSDLQKYISINEGGNYILARSGGGRLQIFAATDVEIIANRNVAVQANGRISLKSDSEVCLSAGGTSFHINSGGAFTNRAMHADEHRGFLPGAFPGPGAQAAAGASCTPITPSPITLTENELKPRDFDNERGFDPTKSAKGPIDISVINCGSSSEIVPGDPAITPGP